MKKGILAMLILFSFAAFAEKTHEKTAKLEKDAYCKAPKSHGDYKKINDKDSRVDIDFENCVFDGENYENAKVGILIQDKDKFENFLKKYKFMHLKSGKDLVNKDGNFFYSGSWAFSNDKSYPNLNNNNNQNNNKNVKTAPVKK